MFKCVTCLVDSAIEVKGLFLFKTEKETMKLNHVMLHV